MKNNKLDTLLPSLKASDILTLEAATRTLWGIHDEDLTDQLGEPVEKQTSDVLALRQLDQVLFQGRLERELLACIREYQERRVTEEDDRTIKQNEKWLRMNGGL